MLSALYNAVHGTLFKVSYESFLGMYIDATKEGSVTLPLAY